MPITIDNGLPGIAMQFGTNDDNEIVFNVSVDSCAWLNIRHLRVHQWAATTYLNIVKNWIEHDDTDKFEPVGLNCAVADN